MEASPSGPFPSNPTSPTSPSSCSKLTKSDVDRFYERTKTGNWTLSRTAREFAGGCGNTSALRFNRKGDYLAAGRTDGKIIIWDMETMGVGMKLHGHFGQVQSISWSRDGRYILSSSQDKRVILWDLQDGSRERVVRFEAMVFNAELHPFNRNLFVVSLFEDDPHLVDITTTVEVKRRLPTMPLTDDPEAPSLAKLTTTFVLFSYLGNHIFSGTSKGWLNIIETESRNVIFSEKLCNHLIPLLRLSNNGNDLLVNSSDRIIRVINLPDLSRLTPSAAAVFTSNPNTPAAVPTPESAPSPEDISTHLSLNVEHKFQDLVNRLRWNSVAFSSPPTLSATPTSTSDYIVATTYMKKDIYIWERSSGSLVKILEHKEEQGIVEWHPNGRPLIATAGVDSGALNIWAVEPQQKWSALAPDFAEVEENVPLEEREDEFDVLPEAEMRKRRENAEDEDVDIWTVERVKGEEEESFVLPVIFGIQDSDDEEEYVSVGVGTMRRKEANEGREWGEGTVEAG